MKRILTSVLTLGIVAVAVVTASNAFFSDTETSTGNILQAGAIDLLISNSSYVTNEDGELVASPDNTWSLGNLAGHLFFNFLDLKPGDIGEDTIGIQVQDNDAWVCAAARVTENSENGLTEPELALGDDDTEGELGEFLNFVFWADDGDNVYEQGEQIFVQGPASNVFGEDGSVVALADSTTNIWNGGTPAPLAGETTAFIGKAWCFGELQLNPDAQDGHGNSNPVDRGTTGFICDGSSDANNIAQTDRLAGDLQFYAVQSRNNETFSCSANYTPDWPDAPQQPLVGAVLGDYTAPGTCDATVSADSNQSIQAAVDSATAGQTICLEDGTYDDDTYPIRLNKDNLTLAGLNAPTTSANLLGGVILDNDGTTLTGVKITDETSLLGETWGVYINTGVDNAKVTYNVITGKNTNPSRGIVNATGTTTNALIAHNVVTQWFTGIFMNPSSGMVMEYNTLTNNTVGSANDGPLGNIVRYSIIKNNTSEGVGYSEAGNPETANMDVNFNNIYGNAGNNLTNYGGPEVDAENNWWGYAAGPGATVNGTVDTDPFETSAYLEN